MNFKLALASATALALTMGSALADSNQAISNQNGDNNSTMIDQSSTTGNGHYGSADVTGNSNDVSIDQNSATSAHGRATVLIDGTNDRGDNNDVTLTQSAFQGHTSGSGQHQTANVDIFGDGNTITGTQKYGTDPQSNVLTITIRGNGEGSNNAVDVYQHGNGETSTTTIWGDHNDVGVDQAAGTNTATVYIDGNAGDDEGDGNRLSIVQGHGSAPFDGTPGNTATVTIYGDNNNTGVFTNSDAIGLAGANSLTPGDIVQSGVMNTATLNVGMGGLDSNGNAFAVNQSGSYNSLSADILGDHNQAVVAQNGETNGTSLFQSGDYNSAAVSQMNNSNVATVSQIGNGNATAVTQN